MPAPAGFYPIAPPGSAPAGFEPISDDAYYAGLNQQSQSSGGSSLGSDLLKYSPVGMVKGLADTLRSVATDVLEGHPARTGTATAAANEHLLEKAKQSYKQGDYGDAAVHFLNYIVPGGSVMEDIGEDVQNGKYTNAAAKMLGLASNALVAPALDIATSPSAARVPGAIVEGVKAAAPDVATGVAKAAAGEAVAKIPGMEWPARIGLQYPALRQVRSGMATGVKAFQTAMEDEPIAAATPAADAGAANNTALMDGIAQGYGYKDFKSAGPARATIQMLANQMRAEEARRAAAAPESPRASTTAAPPPAAAPASATSISQMNPRAAAALTPEAAAALERGGAPAPAAQTPVIDAARAAQQRIEDAADAQAARMQSQADAIVWANRAARADRFAAYMLKNGMEPTAANLARAAKEMGEKGGPPSAETVDMIHDRMGWNADAAKTLTATGGK